MASASKQSSGAPLFLSFWLMFWSMGVGALSAAVVKEGGMLWIFAFTHGGAEIGVAWLLASQFTTAMASTVGAPDITASLSGLTARWKSQRRSVVMLVWFVLVGLLMAVLLIGGTWGPVGLSGATPRAVTIAVILSAAWGVIAWRWLVALREMLALIGSVELSATHDRVEAVHRRGAVEVTHELPTAGLQVSAEDNRLVLAAGDAVARLPCTQGEPLAEALRELAASADDPGLRSEVPEALHALIGRQEPQAER